MSETTWSSRNTLDLVLEARRKRPEAWEALYKRCADDMAQFCRRFLPRGDRLRRMYDTQDVLHEAFAAAMEHIDRLENDASFYAWVRTIIRRKIALARRDKLRDSAGGEPGDRAIEDRHEEEVALAEESLRVLDAIIELFPEHPEAMAVFAYLKLEEGVRVEDLSEKLGLSRRTVYRRLDEAVRWIREKLGIRPEGASSDPPNAEDKEGAEP